MIAARTRGCFVRTRTGWQAVDWAADAPSLTPPGSELPPITNPPPSMPLPAIDRAELPAAMQAVETHYRRTHTRVPPCGPTTDWSRIVGVLTSSPTCSYSHACALARALGYSPLHHTAPTLRIAA